MKKVSEASYDLLRTSIAVDRDRVKLLAPAQSPPGRSVGALEPRAGLDRQLWLESGEHHARPGVGSEGRDGAATLAGMVFSRPRQSGPEAVYAGSGNVLCAVIAALVLAWWPDESHELALALDATTLGQRFTVLCVSVLVRGCAIPVAWKVLVYNQPGSWQPYWEALLAHLDGVVPTDWTVLVLADRGLYAPWLFRQIVAQGWHPFLRINLAAKARRSGSDRWEWLSQWVPKEGRAVG